MITILNRDFQHPTDGWYMIEAAGTHPNRAAGVVQVIDKDATESIVNKFNQDAKAGTLRHGSEMLIDHEHFSDQPDQETRAYGWLQELQNRDDGVYGKIRWTTTGKAAVDGGDYRFFSTEYSSDALEKLDGKKVRPLRLGGLTLTNMNNNRGQKPITNRWKPTMKNIAETFGLPADTKPEAVLNAITNRLESDGSIKNGDYVGHPFHGNQYGEGEGEGGKENKASAKAHEATKGANDKASHEKASKAHARAAKLHRAEGNDAAADYHEHMAKFHAGKAWKANNRVHNDSKDGDPDDSDACKCSDDANAASMEADGKRGHLKAAALHKEAADAHEEAGNDDQAVFHKNAAKFHAEKAGVVKNKAGGNPAPAADNTLNMSKIATTLGLAADASEDDICAAMQNREIGELLTTHKITDPARVKRLTPILASLANREARVAMLAEIAPSKGGTTVLNRGNGGESTSRDIGELHEKAKAVKITNRVNILKAQGLKHDPAWKQATQEIAEGKI